MSAGDLASVAKRWSVDKVDVIGTTETPYKCVGAAVFALQQAGKQVRFVAEPALNETKQTR